MCTGEEFTCTAVLLAVPAASVQPDRGSIKFTPALPAWRKELLQRLLPAPPHRHKVVEFTAALPQPPATAAAAPAGAAPASVFGLLPVSAEDAPQRGKQDADGDTDMEQVCVISQRRCTTRRCTYARPLPCSRLPVFKP